MKFVVLFSSSDDCPPAAPFEGAYLAENEFGKKLWHADISSTEVLLDKIREAGCDFILSADRTITLYDARIE
jgi:hypothetical protein